MLGRIVSRCFQRLGTAATTRMLDEIKELGFRYATQAGATIGITDIYVPPEKPELIARASAEVMEIEDQYRRGLLSDEERHQKVIEVWTQTKDELTQRMLQRLDRFNPVYMMAISGARGNVNQLSQLACMRGLMADPSGRTIEIPVKANFREGLTVLEYFISTHGARKGLADTALRTADSGYLTRRLVDVAQDVIVREEDCGTTEGITVQEIRDGNELIESLADRVLGRIAAAPVVDPRTGETIVATGEEITEEKVRTMEEAGVRSATIRSVLTCRSRYGVCSRCYGRNLATGQLVDVGEAVGIIAAQSIGEPGTQLTMRTFHLGGVAGEDITQGLPRVEELFEARKPKGQAVIADISGKVHIEESDRSRKITVRGSGDKERVYQVPRRARLRVRDGQDVSAGDQLTEGSINPHDILRVLGPQAAQLYLVREVQEVYKSQGVDIHDKHIELIVRQMLKKVEVVEAGDTDLLPGEKVDRKFFEEVNEAVVAQGGEPATARQMLLGITKASLATDSFLSAASFQETTRVLTDAAISGRVDPLLGLKENVIIGKLIPAGTGMSRYRNIKVRPKHAGVSLLEEVEALTLGISRTKAPTKEELEELFGAEAVSAVLEADEADISELPISTRTKNLLKQAKVNTTGDLLRMSEDDLYDAGLGKGNIEELKKAGLLREPEETAEAEEEETAGEEEGRAEES